MKKITPQKTYLDTRVVLRGRDKGLAEYVKQECTRYRRTPSQQLVFMANEYMAAQHEPPEFTDKPNGGKRIY
jgi:hypothetical protein